VNPDYTFWKFGLLFGALSALLGMMGAAAIRPSAERWLASGQFLQGVLLLFVVAGAYFHQSQALYLGGLVVVALLSIQMFLVRGSADSNVERDEEQAR
jgi:hypothetical protein